MDDVLNRLIVRLFGLLFGKKKKKVCGFLCDAGEIYLLILVTQEIRDKNRNFL